MRFFSGFAIFGLSIIFAFIASSLLQGCSGNETDSPLSVEPEITKGEPGSRYLIGYFNCAISPDGAIKAAPVRETSLRYNVTPMLLPPQCNDCISFQVLEFKPAQQMLIVAVTLKNPTSIPVYDVRGILISDHNPPHDIMNRDGYTTQWDNGGPVERNPYILFSKEEPLTGVSTRIFYLVMPKPPSFDFTYAVDVSWPKHAKEPYEVTGYISSGLTPDGGTGMITVFVKDWQDDVNAVTADTTDLNGTTISLTYDAASKTWRSPVTNNQGQNEGGHFLWVWAASADSGDLKTYQKIGYWVGVPPPTMPWGLDSSWPAERCSFGGSGRAIWASGPADGELKWTCPFIDVVWDGSYNKSIIADGTGNVYVPLNNALVAVDISGEQMWTFPVDHATGTFTPFLRNDNVIVWPVNRELSGYDLSFLYFVSTDSKQASRPALLPEIVTAPAIPDFDGNIVIPAGNGVRKCDIDGYCIWSFVPGTGEYFVPRPVIIDGDWNIYFVTDFEGSNTVSVSIDAYGVERWTAPLNGAPLAQPLLGFDGGIFSASTAKDLSQLDKFGIQARNSWDGSGLWPSAYSNYKGLTQFALAEGADYNIYASCSSSDVCYAVDASDGSYLYGFSDIFGKWGNPASAPAIDAEGRVYVGCKVTVSGNDFSTFFGLDPECAELWEYQGEGKGFTGSPVICLDGYLFCLGVNENNELTLYCFGEK